MLWIPPLVLLPPDWSHLNVGLLLEWWLGGTALIEVITDTSLGQSVVSVRQDCPMLGVRVPDSSMMAR